MWFLSIYNLPKTNIAPEPLKIGHLPQKEISSWNHPFSEAKFRSFQVSGIFTYLLGPKIHFQLRKNTSKSHHPIHPAIPIHEAHRIPLPIRQLCRKVHLPHCKVTPGSHVRHPPRKTIMVESQDGKFEENFGCSHPVCSLWLVAVHDPRWGGGWSTKGSPSIFSKTAMAEQSTREKNNSSTSYIGF